MAAAQAHTRRIQLYDYCASSTYDRVIKVQYIKAKVKSALRGKKIPEWRYVDTVQPDESSHAKPHGI